MFSFGAHLQLVKYTLQNSYEEDPISTNADFLKNYDKYPFITHVQPFIHKAGLLKKDDDLQGVVYKGVDTHFDTARFNRNLLAGRFIHFEPEMQEPELVISKKIADLLQLELEDEVLMYFIQNPPRIRRLRIVGIYQTGIEDFDEKIVLGDMEMARKINDWADTLVGGYEIYIDDFDNIDEVSELLLDEVDFHLYVDSVKERFSQIFDWLLLLNRNVYIFLALILAVASFNMISITLILIMERTQMIGLLKAMGATSHQIRTIFSWHGIQLIIRGLLIGNALALLLGYIQHKYNVITLEVENYYMEYVPIKWDWLAFIWVNGMTVLVIGLVLFIPTAIIQRIDPIKTIQFD